MKKSVYFLMTIAAVLLSGCEPMEDIQEEVNAAIDAEPNFGTVEYVLTEDDYTTSVEKGGLGLEDEFFTSLDAANAAIPAFLNERFPVLGEGSIANVTVVIENPNFEVTNFTEYEVTSEEYKELGFKYGNFDSADDMVKFLDYKYPDAAEGDAVELTYEYYAGSTSTRTTTHVYNGETWMEVVTLTKEDYTEMGERFPNFSNREDAIADLSNFLRLRFPYAQEGDTKTVMYARHIGGGKTVKNLETFTFDGTKWTAPGALVEQTLQFGHNGTTWEPDNTIIYNFAPGDYAVVGDALLSVYPEPAANVKRYSSFEVRTGYTTAWTDEMFVEAVGIILDRIDPNAPEGQKYVVNVTTYSGSYSTRSVSVIKQGGEWVAN
ncbi:MAG: hypothetical protein R3209_10155 [Salinimicrobium sediminis]|nr:hypothetical protein [Salinimicrobium sediminis]